MELSVHHHSAPNASSNRQADHCFRTSASAEHPLPEGYCAHIVDQCNRQMHRLLHDGLERNIQPFAWQVWQKLYDSSIHIRSPWYTDTHAFNIVCCYPAYLC